MPKPTEQGFWTGYAKVNDDLRHTYEQVFYGRQLTGDLNEHEVPGMAKAAPEPTTPAPDAQGPYAPPHAHADLYTRIWGPAPSADAGAGRGLAPTQGPGIHGDVLPPEPTASHASGGNAPQIEAPTIEPPRQGGDLTPE
jgi:hypothetical protein